jgi:hypothetical protein
MLPHCSRNNPQRLNQGSSLRARVKAVGRQVVVAVAARRRNGMSRRCRPGPQPSLDESWPPIQDVPSGELVS